MDGKEVIKLLVEYLKLNKSFKGCPEWATSMMFKNNKCAKECPQFKYCKREKEFRSKIQKIFNKND